MKIQYFPRIAMLTLIGSVLSACGASDDSSSIPATPRAQAMTSISSHVRASVGSFDKVILQSNIKPQSFVAFNTMSTTTSESYNRVSAAIQTLVSTLAGNSSLQALQRSLLPPDGTSTPAPDGTPAPSDASMPDDIVNFLGDLLGPSELNGDQIVYSPKIEVLCGEKPEPEKTDCETLYAHITVVQTIDTTQSGSLNVKYDDYSLTVIGYAPDSVYFEMSLEDVKGINTSVDLGGITLTVNNQDFPEIFEGAYRFTLKRISNSSGTIFFSIPRTISIADPAVAEPYSFILDQTDLLFGITADVNLMTASIDLGLNSVISSFMSPDPQDPEILSKIEVLLSGLTGTFSYFIDPVDVSSDVMLATNVSIGVEPLLVNVDGSNSILLDLDPVDLQMNSSDDTIELLNGITASLVLNNVNGYLSNDFTQSTDPYDVTHNATISWSVPPETIMTRFIPADVMANDIYKVLSGGSIDILGVGSVDAPFYNFDLSFSIGDCFAEPADINAVAPYESVTCPN